MVRHPAVVDVVELLRGLLAVRDHLVDHVEERLMALGEVRGLGGPVVHFRVDVDRVLALPRHVHLFAPDALEVGGLAAGAGAGDQQVAAELEIEGRQVGIERDSVLPAGLEAVVGRELGRGAAEVEVHAVEERAVVGDVFFLQGFVVDFRELGEDVVDALGGVAGNVVVGLERGFDVEQDDHGVGLFHADAAGLADQVAALVEHAAGYLEFRRAGDAVVVDGAAGKGHGVAADRDGLEILRRAEERGDRDAGGLVRGEAHGDDAVRVAGEILAGVGHAVAGELGLCDGFADVQAVNVAGDVAVAGVLLEPECARHGECHFGARTGDEAAVRDISGLVCLAVEDELAHLRELFRGGVGVQVIVRAARPDRVLIEDEVFAFGAAGDHGAHVAVADRDHVGPLGWHAAEPDGERFGGGRRVAGDAYVADGVEGHAAGDWLGGLDVPGVVGFGVGESRGGVGGGVELRDLVGGECAVPHGHVVDASVELAVAVAVRADGHRAPCGFADHVVGAGLGDALSIGVHFETVFLLACHDDELHGLVLRQVRGVDLRRALDAVHADAALARRLLAPAAGTASESSSSESAASAATGSDGEAALAALLMQQRAGPGVAFGGDGDRHFMRGREQATDGRGKGQGGFRRGGRERGESRQRRTEQESFHVDSP